MFIVLNDHRYVANFDRLDDAIKYVEDHYFPPYPDIVEPIPNGYHYQYRWMKSIDGRVATEEEIAHFNLLFSYQYVPQSKQQYLKNLKRIHELHPDILVRLKTEVPDRWKLISDEFPELKELA